MVMTDDELKDLGLKYDPGLSFGEIPHLFWKVVLSSLEGAKHVPTGIGKSGIFFCRASDRSQLLRIFHLSVTQKNMVYPDKFRLRDAIGAPVIPFSPLLWDLWLYNSTCGRLVSCRSIFDSFGAETEALSDVNKVAFCRQYHMAETFFPLFQTFYKTWSPKSSLAYMARLASA